MQPVRLKRGGARTWRERQSWQLTAADCRKLIDACMAAWAAGMPMNRFVTAAWGWAGIDAADSVRATGDLVTRAREWMRARGFPMPWAWVQECGPRFGQHCHLLIHVPAELDPIFGPMPLRWVKAILPGPYIAETLETQRLSAGYSANTNPALYEAVLLGKLHYMLKCAPAELEAQLEMVGWGHKPWGQSCPVIGKRTGVWQDWKLHRGQ